MAADLVLLSEQEGIATVTVNRPEKLNALNEEVIARLTKVFEECRDLESTRAVILTGAGDRAFVAGADISVLSALDPSTAKETAQRGQRLTVLMESIGKPVIAAINGYAFGGGLELAMACTVRLAAEGAKMGQPEVKLGLLAGYGGTQRLPRYTSKAKAMDLCLTARMMDAQEAERAGLVSRIVASDKLMDEALAVAEKIANYSLPVVMMIKESINRAYETSLAEGTLFERRVFQSQFSLEDQKEGMAAFVEKRKPVFKNR